MAVSPIHEIAIITGTSKTGEERWGLGAPEVLVAQTSHQFKFTITDPDDAAPNKVLDISALTASPMKISVNNDTTFTTLTLIASGVFETDGSDGLINYTLAKNVLPNILGTFPQSREDGGNIRIWIELEDAVRLRICSHRLRVVDDEFNLQGDLTAKLNDFSNLIKEALAAAVNAPTAAGSGAIAFGDGAVAAQYGRKVFANDKIVAAGDAIEIMVMAHRETVDATPVDLTPDFANAQFLILDAESGDTVEIKVTAYEPATGDTCNWMFKAGMARFGATTDIGTVVKETLRKDQASWDCDLAADDTNESVKITATGQAAKIIHWSASVAINKAS